jgi:hypothetical protein
MLRGIPIGVWSEATTLDKACATLALASIDVTSRFHSLTRAEGVLSVIA